MKWEITSNTSKKHNKTPLEGCDVVYNEYSTENEKVIEYSFYKDIDNLEDIIDILETREVGIELYLIDGILELHIQD